MFLQISHNRAGLGVEANVPESTIVQDMDNKSQLMEAVNPQRPQEMDHVVDVRPRLRGMNYIDNTIGKKKHIMLMFTFCS